MVRVMIAALVGANLAVAPVAAKTAPLKYDDQLRAMLPTADASQRAAIQTVIDSQSTDIKRWFLDGRIAIRLESPLRFAEVGQKPTVGDGGGGPAPKCHRVIIHCPHLPNVTGTSFTDYDYCYAGPGDCD